MKQIAYLSMVFLPATFVSVRRLHFKSFSHVVINQFFRIFLAWTWPILCQIPVAPLDVTFGRPLYLPSSVFGWLLLSRADITSGQVYLFGSDWAGLSFLSFDFLAKIRMRPRCPRKILTSCCSPRNCSASASYKKVCSLLVVWVRD